MYLFCLQEFPGSKITFSKKALHTKNKSISFETSEIIMGYKTLIVLLFYLITVKPF